MIDASKGFIKDGSKNRLREQDIHKIVDIFTRQVELPRYSCLVPVAEINDPKNDYNLNLPRYIASTEPENLQDIEGHLRGGIPERDLDALDRYWKVIPGVRTALFEKAERPGYYQSANYRAAMSFALTYRMRSTSAQMLLLSSAIYMKHSTRFFY